MTIFLQSLVTIKYCTCNCSHLDHRPSILFQIMPEDFGRIKEVVSHKFANTMNIKAMSVKFILITTSNLPYNAPSVYL